MRLYRLERFHAYDRGRRETSPVGTLGDELRDKRQGRSHCFPVCGEVVEAICVTNPACGIRSSGLQPAKQIGRKLVVALRATIAETSRRSVGGAGIGVL